MQTIENSKRKYFTKQQKLKILEELKTGDMTVTNLARERGIHPITLYSWKRTMSQDKPENQPDYQELLRELEKTKTENSHLKKAVGELAIDKQILQTANDILKKAQRKAKFKSPKKSSKKQSN